MPSNFRGSKTAMSRWFKRNTVPLFILIGGAVLLEGCAYRLDTARSGPQPVHGVYVSGGVGTGF